MPWVPAGTRADFGERDLLGVRIGGIPIALYALADGVYATANLCPHLGAQLSFGCVVEGYVECPMHHALFDIRTGVSDGAVTDRNVRTFPVKMEGDRIWVELPEEPAS
ncbi:MAG: Rieske (2Fe-2S) protein [Vicinamibacterales bacterium]